MGKLRGSKNTKKNGSPRHSPGGNSPRRQLSPASDDADGEAIYRKSRGQILETIKSTITAMDFVCTEEVRKYIKLQDQVRKKVGCSNSPGSHVTKRFSQIIRERDDAGKVARKSMEKVLSQVQGGKASKAINALHGLAKLITGELKLKHLEVCDDSLVKFYPASVLRHDSEKSPEDVLDVFFAMVECTTILQNAPKKELLDKNARGLKTLMGGLSRIIMERVRTQNSLEVLVTDAISAFKRFENANAVWSEGSLQKDFEACKKKITHFTRALVEAKVEQDIAALECKLHTYKNQGVVRIDDKDKKAETDETVQKAAVKLYTEQKTFFSLESHKWVLQRNYIPEIYNDLYPTFSSSLDVFLRSIDATNDDYRSVNRLITDRTLAEYNNITYLLPSVLSAKYERYRCLLKRYSMAHRQDIKALCKELAMQKTLEAYVVERVSAVFGDNSDIYLHFEQGHSDIYEVLESADFNNSVHNPILLIWHMLHVVAKCHQAGVILGDIRPNSFVIDNNGLPHIHAFKHARILGQTQGVRESVIDYEGGEFQPPELRGHEDTGRWGEVADMYALGKTIAVIAGAGKASLDSVGAQKDINTLIAGMTNNRAESRWKASYALNRCSELLSRLKAESASLHSRREGVKELKELLLRTREDLDYAAVLAKEDLLEIAHKKEEIGYQEQNLEQRMDKMSHYVHAMKDQTRQEARQREPDYWSGKSDKLFEFYPIPKASHLFEVFRNILQTDDPKSLNQGRDVREKGKYSALHLTAVWRMENSSLWRNYSVERSHMRELVYRRNIDVRTFYLRQNLFKYVKQLPGNEDLYTDVNETFLLHGTSPDPILSICTSGVNERFTSLALFGKGTYFAEDPAKTDQYVQGDGVLGSHPALHQRLFPPHGHAKFPEYPYKAYYIFLCRVLIGFAVHVHCVDSKTEQMYNIHYRGARIFATNDRRELAEIPGIVTPPMSYHSLIAEKGGAIVRFREFCQFHSTRVYPEYLICYTRK
eukprot:GEMP01012202.1.p1 GENE.GEMP01012202.1~~GEMP01012202.1.p1  ORF type:complete len:993 (+),score=159.88 GEMP01012202.1:182-3160(+)